MDLLPLIIARVFPPSRRFETRRERFAVGLALVIISARPLEDPSKAHVAQGVLISRKQRNARVEALLMKTCSLVGRLTLGLGMSSIKNTSIMC